MVDPLNWNWSFKIFFQFQNGILWLWIKIETWGLGRSLSQGVMGAAIIYCLSFMKLSHFHFLDISSANTIYDRCWTSWPMRCNSSLCCVTLTQKIPLKVLFIVFPKGNFNLHPSLTRGIQRIHEPGKLWRQIRAFVSKRPITRRNNWALTSDSFKLFQITVYHSLMKDLVNME